MPDRAGFWPEFDWIWDDVVKKPLILQEHEIEKPSFENQGISVKCLKRGSLNDVFLEVDRIWLDFADK